MGAAAGAPVLLQELLVLDQPAVAKKKKLKANKISVSPPQQSPKPTENYQQQSREEDGLVVEALDRAGVGADDGDLGGGVGGGAAEGAEVGMLPRTSGVREEGEGLDGGGGEESRFQIHLTRRFLLRRHSHTSN